MKFLEPSIVIIDDKKEEVAGILDYYSKIGVGCRWFNASYYDDDADTMPDSTFSDVSIIFLDLYYSDKFDAEQCSNWVRSIVSAKTFYILILWTKDKSKAEEVETLLSKFNCNPYICLVKSKIEYQVEGRSDYTKLFTELSDEIEKTPALEEIQLWKRNIKLSANEILGNLAKKDIPNKFVTKLKKIIISHGGTNLIKDKDNKHKRGTLFDALDNALISNNKKNTLENDISDVNNNILYNLEDIENLDVDKELNSWFHFKLENNLSKIITPGVIAINNHSLFKNIYSIQDDPKLKDFFVKEGEKRILIDDIVVIINRPCDIAQNKFGKNIKLLSGVKINKISRKKGHKIDFGNLTPPDSLKIYDNLYFNEEENDITLMFDFRYIFSIPEKIYYEKFHNIKIFNKELLSDIQVEYSSYSSRLGITQMM